MHIDTLKVEGYRSLKSITWKPGPLNILIGSNASGKTNLLSAIELLGMSSKGRLTDFIRGEGGFLSLAFDGAADRIRFELTTSPMSSKFPKIGKEPRYELCLEKSGQTSGHLISRELLADDHAMKTGRASQPFKFIERDLHHAVVFNAEEKNLIEQITPEEETILSSAHGAFTFNPLVGDFGDWMAGWTAFFGFETGRGAPVRQPIITSHREWLDPSGENLVAVLHTLYTGRRDFQEAVDAAMSAAFGKEFEGLLFAPASEQRVQLGVRWRGLSKTVPATNLSDGTLRFLFLIAILANPNTPGVVAIDEPEAGLHPSMLPIIAEYAQEAATRSQIVFSTHSPDFLDAFKDAAPTVTVVTLENGETMLKTLAGEELEYWLNVYSLAEMQRSGAMEAI